jgi:hypothetical protein
MNLSLSAIFGAFREKLKKPPPKQTKEGESFSPYKGCVLIPGELVLGEEIASSGMGSVWKAHNFKKQKDVAVKFPLKSAPFVIYLSYALTVIPPLIRY